jgi:ubiquinone/menaquinone biosynthesis C-methylase UbiE
MPESTRDVNLETSNLATWSKPEVASYYSSLTYLTPCEQLLFDKYLRPGMAILDVGVGGGRTTPYLSSIAGRYVGADYSAEMIAACRKKFPTLQFETLDAADLSIFPASAFDAVVMAFNTIDNLIPDESRHQALLEAHRVLKPDGVLIFSSHNIHSTLVRLSWNPQRLQSLAKKVVGDSVFHTPLLWSLTAARVALAVLQSFARSSIRVARRTSTRAFWRGDGYLVDTSHGWTKIHFTTPERVEQELAKFGFRQLHVLGDDYPQTSRRYVTDWYYYVFAKLEAESRSRK